VFATAVAVVRRAADISREGYTLDVDSTRRLHEDGHQEGVKVGYTRTGLKPCLHPLLAVLAGGRLVVQLWLRSGNATCGSNVEAFFLALWDARPRHLRLRAVRADSGFGAPELLALREQLGCQYIVLAKLSEPIQDLVRRDLVWTPTELAGTDVAELRCRAQSWPHPRRLTVLRHRAAERPEAGGKKLIEVPGFVLQSLVTSLPPSMPPLADWRDYDGRADCENVIKELQQGPADLVPALDLGHRSGADARDADV
jgi:hypothetical protein